MEFQLSYCKYWKMTLWKCCIQYASKFGKLSSGHRTGKGQFSFQSQRKAMPKNAQTTAQLGFPGDSEVKASASNVGDLGSIPGSGRSPGEGNGNPLQYSGLENSTGYVVHGVTKSWTQLCDFHFHFPLPFLNPAWTSGSSQFTDGWSLAWRVLSITLLMCEMSAVVQ